VAHLQSVPAGEPGIMGGPYQDGHGFGHTDEGEANKGG
jgi:hypothetical protein